MANPLFYKNVVPMNAETHRELRLSPPENPLSFAKQANLIPALVDEFELALGDITVGFLPGPGQPSAVFITGLEPGTNAYISDAGLWDGGYVPAYLRRYPFIIGDVTDGEPILCFDDSYAGFGAETGERFFNSKGAHEPALTQALTLAQSYRNSTERTEAFCAKLQELKLLIAVTLDATAPDGKKSNVHGLMIVDEAALNALSEEQILDLHKSGFLKAIYLHIASLRAISKLNRQFDVQETAPQAADVNEKQTARRISGSMGSHP